MTALIPRSGILRAAALTAAIVVAPSSPAPASSHVKADGDDRVVAIVNGDRIYRSDVEDARRRLPDRLRRFPAETVFSLLVNSLIDTKLASAVARAQGLHEDEGIRRRLLRIEDQILEREFLTRAIESRITEAAMKERYERLVRESGNSEEVHARHILVETEVQAEEIIVELEGGADFAEMAKSRSIGPSAPKGGDLGFFSRDKMVPEFAEAAFAMGLNESSKVPVRTQFGWHVIRVEERRRARPPMFVEVEAKLRDELSREARAAMIKELRDGAELRRFAPDGTELSGTDK